MSLGNDPRRTTTLTESEAVAAARQAQNELRRDGPAPARDAILREMGRHPDGRPRPGRETLPAHEASRVARELLSGNWGEGL